MISEVRRCFMERYILKEFGRGDVKIDFWLYKEPQDVFFKMVRCRVRTFDDFLNFMRQYNNAIKWLNVNPINFDELPKYGLRWIAAHNPKIRIHGKTDKGISIRRDVTPEAFKKVYPYALNYMNAPNGN